MSFQNMKKDELLELAVEQFGVEVKQEDTKVEIIAALEENGVTWEMVKTFDKNAAAYEDKEVLVEKEAVVVAEPVVVVHEPIVVAPAKVLVKMDRANPVYEIRGVKFTREHPFALMDKSDAEYVSENVDGFKVATAAEAQRFYQ